MSKFTLFLAGLSLVVLYCTYNAEAAPRNSCPNPPADAEFHPAKKGEICSGIKLIKGKKCCCKCANASNIKARGYYCNPAYCPMQANKSTTSMTTTSTDSTSSSSTTTGGSTTTTASTTSTTAGATTSTTGGSTTSTTAGSTTSTTAGSTTSTTAGSTTSTTTASST